MTPTWAAIANEIEFHSMKHGKAHACWKEYLYDMAKVADLCIALSKDSEIKVKLDKIIKAKGEKIASSTIKLAKDL